MAVSTRNTVYEINNLLPTKDYVLSLAFDYLARENKPVSMVTLSQQVKSETLENALFDLQDGGFVDLEIEKSKGIKTAKISTMGLSAYKKLKETGKNIDEFKRITGQ